MAGEIQAYCLLIRNKTARLNQRLLDSVPVRWLIKYERRIASVFYILWALGCGYWMYWLTAIDVEPHGNLLHFDEPRYALVMLFFGAFGSVFAVFMALFLLKFAYNLIREGVSVFFPRQLYSLSKCVCCLIALNFAFLYGEDIKSAGLTAYDQVSEMMQTSKKHDEIVEENILKLRELMDQVDAVAKER